MNHPHKFNATTLIWFVTTDKLYFAPDDSLENMCKIKKQFCFAV